MSVADNGDSCLRCNNQLRMSSIQRILEPFILDARNPRLVIQVS